MWHLAIETSGLEASLALLHCDQVVKQVDLPHEQRTTSSFAPALQSLLADVPGDAHPSLVSVSVGPGSFTGLRIGITAAKTLCFAWGCDLVAVDTLAILCHQQRGQTGHPGGPSSSHEQIAVCTNAYRGQVFMRIEPIRRTDHSPIAESRIVDRDVWEQASAGPGIFAWGRDVEAETSASPDPTNRQRTRDRWPRPTADALGQLAWQFYLAGQRDDYWTLTPRYLRPSAAEEKVNAALQS
ncbi:MAG: tRNA (adenosine(37)-N6)-threonylcarbamoyltransferase complex dimerization subunit type 1 TsaB [Pirellulaceae bacterium]